MLTLRKQLGRRIGIALSLVILSLGAGASAAEDKEPTIYDSQVLKRMEFSDSQRVVVEQIMQESGAVMAQIFQKYGIDPHAKPDFDKLMAARHELQELEALQKRRMKAVLSRQQFKYYLGLLQITASNVVRATRNKP
ncbi:MAG: hypothetical protein AAGF81_01050 [Pseudomonadota bacterium]